MDLELLSKIGTLKNFRPHDFICIENDLGKEMYILLKGTVGVYLNSFDNSFEIDQLEPGCFFGEMSLLEHTLRSATVIALDEGATVIEIKKQNFSELLDHVDISFKILKSLLDRVNKMLDQLTTEDAAKAKKYMTDGYYPLVLHTTEQDFYNIISFDKQKAIDILKYLSRTIRKINEEIIDITNAKHIPLTLSNINNLDFIPNGHHAYSFLIKESFDDILIDRPMQCPICGKEFKRLQPRLTKIKLKAIQNDLRKTYENFDPLWFNITTCPNCLYSNYSNEFIVFAPKYATEVSTRLKEVTNLKDTMQLECLDINRLFYQYYLALLCSVDQPMNELKKGRLWLNLSWLYKDVQDEKMYTYAYTKAFEHYHTSYLHSNNMLCSNDEQSLLIILGELYVRQEQYEQALELLLKATRIKNGSPELTTIASKQLLAIASKEISNVASDAINHLTALIEDQ